MNSLYACTSSHPRVTAGLLTVLCFGLAGCGLISIDPDEIDVADEVGGTVDEASDEGTDTSNGVDEGTDESSTAADDEDTEDASSTTEGSDGPLDSESDTEGDATTDTGDTSDVTTDDADTSDPGCDASEEVFVDDNEVSVAAGASVYESPECGGTQSETVYWFTAPAGGDYYFTLVGAEFVGVLHLLDADCAPIPDACSNSGEQVHRTLSGNETVLVVVDSDGGTGSATLSITGP